jgi:phosphoribosylformylglycinamidine synthase I
MVGFQTELVHINQLLKDPASLLSYHFLVLPGGFSYGDDLGAGTLLAKNLEIHLGRQLHQFVEEGRPVLGICNGFQVLVRLGLLPGEAVVGVVPCADPPCADPGSAQGTIPTTKCATLTENESAQFECRWVTLAVQPGPCIFTRDIERPIELPVAHGEGQFVFNDHAAAIATQEMIPLVYISTERSTGTGSAQGTIPTVPYPANPNGSVDNIAGVCNARGNVFGLMPHPERYISALQHPLRRRFNSGQSDGLLLFKNAYTYASQLFLETEQMKGTMAEKEGEAAQGTGSAQGTIPTAYAASGVDIAAGEQAVRLMKEAVRSTQGPEVLAGLGAFAGVFSAKSLARLRRPAIVASTDGVGTKSLLAAQAGRYDTIGYDIVNHSINDLLMQGARPLFFMDYIAMGKLDPIAVATIVKGIANACREAGCALLGGETAEMPDVYLPGAFDLAGTIVGVVEEDEIINGSTIDPGDVILGLPSNGLHTNGYSLARRVFAPYAFDTVFPALGEPLIDALLRPHRSYLREILPLKDYLADRGRYIKGMAHITGGGFAGNISRILPTGTQAMINTHAWSVPPLFQLLAQLGNVSHVELYQTFNMGIGVVLILSPKGAMDARCILPGLITIGSIQEGNGVVLQ